MSCFSRSIRREAAVAVGLAMTSHLEVVIAGGLVVTKGPKVTEVGLVGHFLFLCASKTL